MMVIQFGKFVLIVELFTEEEIESKNSSHTLLIEVQLCWTPY